MRPMATVHFHVAHPCPEASFTLGHFFGELAGHTAVEVPDRATFINMEGPRVAYGGEKIQGALTIRPWALAGLLEPLPADPPMSTWQSMPVLFPVAEGDLPFDPVAGTYFHLTRMEEDHLPVEEHGRPRTSAMHAARHGYLHRPVVDEWLHAVLAYWRTLDPLAPQPRRTYSQTATMDVDNGAMYLGRAWWRTVGGTGRDLLKGRLGRVRDRAATLLGLRADPYAVHGSFIRLAQENGARTMLNFMAADRGEHDHAVEIRRGHMRRMLLGLEQGVEVGLHPGYHSSERPGTMAREKALLEEVLGGTVCSVRQHYLRYRTPVTQREAMACGMVEEHSMGLADNIGFRAGTCSPWPFFDRSKREVTTLRIHPFALMDSALAYKMDLSPAAALQEACRLVDTVRRVNGCFISVWHERFLSGYGDERGWEMLAPHIIRHARP
jgi:hypothetical protein